MENDIKELDLFFTKLKTKAVTAAARQSLNKTANQVRNFSVQRLRAHRNLAPASLKRRIFINKATGNNLARLTSQVIFTGIPLPLTLFIKGVKRPRRGPGRGARVFEIQKGNSKPKRGLYVAKAKHGKERYQVFRRKDPNSKDNKKMIKQSASSVVELFRKRIGLRTTILTVAQRRFKKNFDSALTFQLNKLK